MSSIFLGNYVFTCQCRHGERRQFVNILLPWFSSTGSRLLVRLSSEPIISLSGCLPTFGFLWLSSVVIAFHVTKYYGTYAVSVIKFLYPHLSPFSSPNQFIKWLPINCFRRHLTRYLQPQRILLNSHCGKMDVFEQILRTCHFPLWCCKTITFWMKASVDTQPAIAVMYMQTKSNLNTIVDSFTAVVKADDGMRSDVISS